MGLRCTPVRRRAAPAPAPALAPLPGGRPRPRFCSGVVSPPTAGPGLEGVAALPVDLRAVGLVTLVLLGGMVVKLRREGARV